MQIFSYGNCGIAATVSAESSSAALTLPYRISAGFAINSRIKVKIERRGEWWCRNCSSDHLLHPQQVLAPDTMTGDLTSIVPGEGAFALLTHGRRVSLVTFPLL